MPGVVLLAALAGGHGAGQLAGHLQRLGIGQAGQDHLGAAGVQDGACPVPAPPGPQLGSAVHHRHDLDAAAPGVGQQGRQWQRAGLGDLVQRPQHRRVQPPAWHVRGGQGGLVVDLGDQGGEHPGDRGGPVGARFGDQVQRAAVADEVRRAERSRSGRDRLAQHRVEHERQVRRDHVPDGVGGLGRGRGHLVADQRAPPLGFPARAGQDAQELLGGPGQRPVVHQVHRGPPQRRDVQQRLQPQLGRGGPEVLPLALERGHRGQRLGAADRRGRVGAPAEHVPPHGRGRRGQPLRVEHVHRPAARTGRYGQLVQVPAGAGDHRRARMAGDDLGQRPGLAGPRRRDVQDVFLHRDPQGMPVVGAGHQHRGLRRAQQALAGGHRAGHAGPRPACPTAATARTPSRGRGRGAAAAAPAAASPAPGAGAAAAAAGPPTRRTRPRRPRRRWRPGPAGPAGPATAPRPGRRSRRRSPEPRRGRPSPVPRPAGQSSLCPSSLSGVLWLSAAAACRPRTCRTSSRRAVPGL